MGLAASTKTALCATFAIVILFTGLIAATASETEVARAPAPDWYDRVPLPGYSTSPASKNLNGNAWLLTDNQVMHRSGGYDYVQRHGYKIIDRVGLEEGAKIQFSYDPSYQTPIINFITVTRNGVPRELRDEAIINSYRSETDAYLGILTGRVSVIVLMPKIEVGDIIDYGYTIQSSRSLGASLYDDHFAVEFETSVNLIRKRIVWPEDQPLRLRTLGQAPEPVISVSNGYRTYLWEINNPVPVKTESALPTGVSSLSLVEIGSLPRWKDLVARLLPHYQPDLNLPEDFRRRLDGIARKWPRKQDRMTEALRIVQDEIRYVSLSIGEGALIPRKPTEVLKTGFGDCKDKSLLLVSALRYLDIDSGLALARLSGNELMVESLPVLRLFDHVVAFVRIEGKVHWIDPTDSQQGGRGFSIVEPDYGYALPLELNSDALVKMSAGPIFFPDRVVREEFVLPTTASEPLLLTVHSTYLGNEADYYRRRRANDSDSAIASSYLDYYAGKFAGIEELEKISIEDNREINVLTVVEKYILKNPKLTESGLGSEFPVKGDIGLPNLDDLTVAGRTKPYNAGRPFAKLHIVNVKNLKAIFSAPDKPQNVEKWFDYDIRSSSTSTEFTLEWQLRGKFGIISASDVKSFAEAVNNIGDTANRLYDFTYDENADTAEARYERFKQYLAIGFAVIGILFVSLKLWQKNSSADKTLFLPVGPRKFFVMYNLTGGLYAIYWAWMCIRHHRAKKRFDLVAFVAGFFYPVTNLFMSWRVRQRFPGFGMQTVLVLLLVLAFSGYYFGDLYGSFFLDWPPRPTYQVVATTFAESIALLPMVYLVRKANQEVYESDDKYRSFSEWDLLAIMVVGFIYYCTMIG
jgi:transglutaminase-like putative cysteine protease